MSNKPSPPSAKSPEQIHYENLSSFLKWSIGLAGSAIALIISVALYFTYKDTKDMKDEYRATIGELKSEISNIKSDAQKTAKEIKDDAKDVVKSANEYSEREIDRIKLSTNDIALKETQKNIDAIFSTDKIQKLIENQATKEIKNRVSEIVREQTKNISKFDAAASSMISGHIEGLNLLKSYFTKAESPEDSVSAKTLYDNICADYEERALKQNGSNPPVNISADFKANLRADIMKGRLPTERNQKELLINLMSQINNVQNRFDLTGRAFAIYGLNYTTGNHFKCFEFDEINAWYNRLK